MFEEFYKNHETFYEISQPIMRQYTLTFVLHIFFTLNFHHINCINITFIPKPKLFTLADLPPPNVSELVLHYAKVVPVPSNPELFVPKGFIIKVHTTDVEKPRYLQYTPEDDMLVSESQINRISCLLDTDKDGYPDKRVTIADETNGLSKPFGMAFSGQYFYVADQYTLRRFNWTGCTGQLSGNGEVLMSYTGERHWTRTIVIPPTNDRLYISIGSASNVNVEPLPLASIQVANLEGTNQKPFATGLRNAVGLAFHPKTQELYATCQERDEIGDELVPDFFTNVKENDFFGWPYTYLSPNFIDPRRTLANGSSERPDLVARTRTPDVLIQSHSSTLGVTFYTGKQFPERYRSGAFVALRGSGNRQAVIGSNIIFIPFNETTNRPINYYEDFVYGFLINSTSPTKFGSPIGLLELKDGSIIFTDEDNNRIYQIQYMEKATQDVVGS
ncbi:unnamed protein product [Rotaria sp. Silwood1]|nr:unnamed protein product [Rotaria sp. Silwood1]